MQDSWSMLKEELAKQGFNSSQILLIYSAISDTCSRRNTRCIKV
jgi:hypothetical protein